MKKYFAIILLLVVWGCKPEKINITQVITNLTVTNKTPMADGTTIVYISASINNLADADKQSVVFETSAGQFVATTPNDTLLTQAATFLNGKLTASVQLKVPNTAGKIYISAKPLATSKAGDFVLKDTITAVESLPSTLMLTPSASSVKQNFGSEILLTALLKNIYGKLVSTGEKVVFEDYYPSGLPVHGVFRAQRDTTDVTSTATANYSQGAVPALGSFYIKCTYLDKSGSKTQIKDSCLVNVTN